MDLIFPFSESKLKPHLKMASKRIQIANSKRTAHSAHGKREIAKLLENGKYEKALIRVEHIIRDDFTTEAYEILELMTDLLHERVKHLAGCEECPPDLLEAVATVLWASSRVDISELEDARKQLIKKYGKEFYEQCRDNSNEKVNSRVLLRLNILPPEPLLIRRYLIEIANQYNVEWNEEKCPIDETGRRKDEFMGSSVQPAATSGLAYLYAPESPQTNNNDGQNNNNGGGLAAPPPSYNESFQHQTIPSGPSSLPPPTYTNAAQTINYGNGNISVPPTVSPHDMEEEPPGFQLPSAPTGPPLAPRNNPPPSPARPPPSSSLPNPPAPPSNPSPSTAPSYDDLAARFAALKK